MKGLLKFITCGSVDDGKSTLIGHMLYDAKLLFTDQKRALELDSKVGSRGGEIDYSLLLDGLMAEREQGITIDVAYRYFTSEKRSFIVADTPGHEEYTRNMAVGASFANLAVILVDSVQGVLLQTKRHTRICSLMGIHHFVFTVNKMDLVHYDRRQFERIEKEIKKLMIDFNYESLKIIPVSATEGDNVTNLSDNMPWYKGGTLLNYLEQVDVLSNQKLTENFIMPIQRVCRPDHTFRGFQGQIEAGNICVEDEVGIFPSGEIAKVKAILIGDKDSQTASEGQPATILLDREIDVSRGCVLTKNSTIKISDLFTITLLWMDDDRLVQGNNYYLKVGTKTVLATVMNIRYRIEINSGEHLLVDYVYKNEIISCDISTSDKIVFDKFVNTKALGGIILIDRVTNQTAACGVIEHELRRSNNIVWQEMEITKAIRAKQMGQKPFTIWFTGLSGSGKSTLANGVEKCLVAMGKHTMILDGDNIRLGLNRNLGFIEKDRVENIRRIAEVASLMNQAGLIVLVACISPYKQLRRNIRNMISDDFIEVYVNTPIEECEKRDRKGLYKKARLGEIPNFTGVSGVYDPPESPEIIIDTSVGDIESSIDYMMEKLHLYLT